LSVQLVSKISNLCDHKSPTSQTDGQTDGRHAIPRPRKCTKVHCAVKTILSQYKLVKCFPVYAYMSQLVCFYTVGHKKTCKFYFWDNSGKYGPILIILSPLQSVMNCRVRRYKISHLSLNLLLHYLAKFKCSKYIPLQRLFSSKVVQNPLSTVNIYDRWYVFIHVCMQINCSMFLNCLLLADMHALSRARSVSMDAPVTCYSMLSEALEGAVAKYHTDNTDIK